MPIMSALLHEVDASVEPGTTQSKGPVTALYGLITVKNRQKVVSREADDVVRVDVEFNTSQRVTGHMVTFPWWDKSWSMLVNGTLAIQQDNNTAITATTPQKHSVHV